MNQVARINTMARIVKVPEGGLLFGQRCSKLTMERVSLG